MKVKVGTDLVRISRITALSSAAKDRIFHSSELKNASDEHLASVFAIKECCKKIFGTSLPWKSVEVKRSPAGKPQALLSSDLQEQVKSLKVSASHEGDYALAFVVALLH